MRENGPNQLTNLLDAHGAEHTADALGGIGNADLDPASWGSQGSVSGELAA